MENILFYILSAIAVGSALMTVLNRNPVGSAISLIVAMIALAGIYASLDAHFIAVIQILVYAGAVMVLFLFVIMLLNLREGADWDWTSRGFNLPLSLAGILLAFFAVKKLVGAVFGDGVQTIAKGVLDANYGTTKAVGQALYTDYLLPFEATSVLLLAAIVGAVILAKSKIGIEEENKD
jgi:NADH-quinone oxidoreductase subunit J